MGEVGGDDGYCSRTVSDAARRKRRHQSCRSFTCVSPRLIFSRWFSGGNQRVSSKFGGNGVINGGKEMVGKSIGFQSLSPVPAENSEVVKVSTSNLGAGFDLLYLVAASRNELSKMAVLHKQMEIMLHNFQAEFRNKNQEKLQLTEYTMDPSFSNSNDVQKTLYVQERIRHDYLSSNGFRTPGINSSSCGNKTITNLRIDQMEDELESELDRLQLQLEAGVFPKYSNQQHLEINVEASAPEMSLAASFEEISEHPDEVISFGVDPKELERRLHQLLEERQQEEINELESALEHSKEQLCIKERELSWWKHTVSLISQHVKEHA